MKSIDKSGITASLTCLLFIVKLNGTQVVATIDQNMAKAMNLRYREKGGDSPNSSLYI
jgi:hypothetical protein